MYIHISKDCHHAAIALSGTDSCSLADAPLQPAHGEDVPLLDTPFHLIQ